MDGMIKCPACGENNSSELDYCQKCNAHLRPFDGGVNAAFVPGQFPDKKKNTAELEPILPQWLRDARQQSRQTSQDDDSTPGMQPLKTQQPVQPTAAPVDLLAGLQSHADDDTDDETPDWLASITGVTNKPKKAEAEAADVRRVEMGGRDDFAQDAPVLGADNKTPSWLADIQSQPKSEKDELTDWFKAAANPTGNDSDWLGDSTVKNDFTKNNDFTSEFNAPAESSETPDWLRQMQADDSAKNDPIQAAQTFASNDDAPDWLKDMRSESSVADVPIQAEPTSNSSDDTPDWLKGMQAADSTASSPIQAGTSFGSSDDAPDWLKSMQADDTAATPIQAGQSFNDSDDLPAWLQQANAQQTASDDDQPSWLNEQKSQPMESASFSEPIVGGGDAGSLSADDAPDWLKGMQSTSALPKENPLRNTSPLWLKDNSAAESVDANVPAWLSPNAPVVNEVPAAQEDKSDEADLADIPNWLKAAAPQSSIFSEPAVEPQEAFSSDTPDWLSAFKSVDNAQPASPFESDVQDANALAAPAFTDNSFNSGGDNSLFNETPDWLSNTGDIVPTAEPSINSADTLAAGELPSWVQAMRPVDTGSTQKASNFSSDQTMESRGALSGLQGVLPSVPGYAPSSKPKAYSILLQATEEQKSHALLLEQILSAETEPQPIASYLPLVASRPLRWFIAFAVLALITTVTVLKTQIFTLPALSMNTPNELKGALDVAQNVTEGAPVLVVMDYAPSHAAELEAAAAPMLDQMDLLRHPKLVFVSTNEMGAVLTERLLALPTLKDRYQGEGQFTNLGYLPGSELGIRAFVKNPLQTMPLDVFQTASPLQDGISVAQFVAVVVLTDNADSGRIWIEQATAATAPIPFPAPIVLITSAQAGPMIQPYYASGQVQGIVNGLYGAAIFEQNNAGRPGTARKYWDAYSLGMLFAMILLILGGLWNLALGARDHSAAGEAI